MTMHDDDTFDFMACHEEEYHGGKSCDCGKNPPLAPHDRYAADITLRELIAQLTSLVAKTPDNPKTEEVRQFIRKHQHVPEFKQLAITLLLLAEGEK